MLKTLMAGTVLSLALAGAAFAQTPKPGGTANAEL